MLHETRLATSCCSGESRGPSQVSTRRWTTRAGTPAARGPPGQSAGHDRTRSTTAPSPMVTPGRTITVTEPHAVADHHISLRPILLAEEGATAHAVVDDRHEDFFRREQAVTADDDPGSGARPQPGSLRRRASLPDLDDAGPERHRGRKARIQAQRSAPSRPDVAVVVEVQQPQQVQPRRASTIDRRSSPTRLIERRLARRPCDGLGARCGRVVGSGEGRAGV